LDFVNDQRWLPGLQEKRGIAPGQSARIHVVQRHISPLRRWRTFVGANFKQSGFAHLPRACHQQDRKAITDRVDRY